MTSIAMAIAIVLVLLLVTYVGVVRGDEHRFAKELHKRGVKPDTIQDYDGEQGFLLFDYVYGGSIGIGSPVVWWCTGSESESLNFYTIQLVDLPKSRRTLPDVRQLFPGKHIVESTTLPSPISPQAMEKIDL